MKIEGREGPLRFKLLSNCHPDLAGWKFKVVRTDPIPDFAEPLTRLDGIATDQRGHVGDITADQMLKHFERSVQEFVERSRAGEPPPTEWRKSLIWNGSATGTVAA